MTTKRNIMEEFELDEISGVDFPAQVGARVTIMKRALPTDGEGQPTAKRLRLLSDENGHTHLIDDSQDGGQTSYEHSPGEDMGHSHPWVRNDDGSVSIGMSDGHTHNVIQKQQPAGEAGSCGKPEDIDMTKQNDAAGEQAVTKEQHEAVKAQLQLAKAYGRLTDAQKAYAANLSEGAERDAFVQKSDAERAAIVEKATAADPVVYTRLDGTELRKSAGELVIQLAKDADESKRELLAEKAARSQDRLSKRADAELGNLPGESVAKVALLRAVEGISDESVRKQVDELLKAANDRGSAAFESIGTAAKGADVKNAETKLDELAQKRATANGIDFHKAYAEVLATPEGRALYAQTR